MKTKWTTEQIMRAAYLRLQEKMSWPSIKKQMEKEGHPVRSADNYGQTIRKHIKEYEYRLVIQKMSKKQRKLIGGLTLLQENNADILPL